MGMISYDRDAEVCLQRCQRNLGRGREEVPQVDPELHAIKKLCHRARACISTNTQRYRTGIQPQLYLVDARDPSGLLQSTQLRRCEPTWYGEHSAINV
jgi:hypothetical protein